MQQILAARWWGYSRISDFDQAPKAERIEVLAAYEAHHKMQAINAYENVEESKRRAATSRQSANQRRLGKKRR